ncbi:hypothetical protein L2E82_39981 [Cichorium intybus]|uniref:Uncharacterized protein n=1 Tax=Cichorium intybus TaxID=13427 RepID=A0ACB9AJ75_CICIN|nr:hypothetical protein L2E82_39981 [Cichorium intybus]
MKAIDRLLPVSPSHHIDEQGLHKGRLVDAFQVDSYKDKSSWIEFSLGIDAGSSQQLSRGESNTKLGLLDIDHTKERKNLDSRLASRHVKYFARVTSITGALYPLPKEERRAGIKRELEKIQLPGNDCYLPTAPNKLDRGIQVNSGIPLQSAAKVPIMITFDVVDRDGDPRDIKHQGDDEGSIGILRCSEGSGNM